MRFPTHKPSHAIRTYSQLKAMRQHGASRPSAARRGYNRKWAKYRAVFLREHPLCMCGPDCCPDGCRDDAECVDHIQPVENGQADPKFWEPSNHQALSCRCHSRKTARENRQAAVRVTGAKILEVGAAETVSPDFHSFSRVFGGLGKKWKHVGPPRLLWGSRRGSSDSPALLKQKEINE